MTLLRGSTDPLLEAVIEAAKTPPVERSIAIGDGSTVRGYRAYEERARAAQENADGNEDEQENEVVAVANTKPIAATPRDPDAPLYGGGRPDVDPGTGTGTYVVDRVMARQLGIL
ncbi:hypothetical protein [Gordonia sp. OPL2]|uniref:hypothetical protein n=1 Tax=Gordonia sp. OPL2 TaxID=2486274 RepID=UPI00165638F0|nr:hypothetical protein [Gordonia sp. OPL2]RPA12624.1 hypothetical protein EEB19_05080 [Gordonia sp. OPL2]